MGCQLKAQRRLAEVIQISSPSGFLDFFLRFITRLWRKSQAVPVAKAPQKPWVKEKKHLSNSTHDAGESQKKANQTNAHRASYSKDFGKSFLRPGHPQ